MDIRVAIARFVPAVAFIPLVLLDHTEDVLGTSALFSLVASFAITPIQTVTGWGWHIILRRDFGLWATGFAVLDLMIAGFTAKDGWLAGVAGQATLVAGSVAALLLVPLAVTSNKWSMKRLGRTWKRFHKLVYVVFAAIAAHLYFLEGWRGVLEIAVLVGPLMVLRLGPVRRWFVHRRKRQSLVTH